MTAENPLPLLASLVRTGPKTMSLSTQKICKRGNPRGAVETIHITAGQGSDKDTAQAIVKTFKKLRIYHHDQPHIEQLLNAVLARADMVALNNDFVCTMQMIEDTGACDYESGLMDLATREGISSSLIDAAQNDSEARCAIYSSVFSAYIRNLREDVFGEPTPTPGHWIQTLNPSEQSAISQSPATDDLPPGWTIEEAQSLWLMSQSGEDVALLATMVGQPEPVLRSICDLFDRAASTS